MFFLAKLAFLNLTRHKRRTFITAFAIAIGILMFIYMDSMLLGADQESVRNLKWYETSSGRILNSEYWENRFSRPLDLNIPEADKIIGTLDDAGYTATGRVVFTADMIFNSMDFGEDGSMSIEVTAIDVESDFDVFHYQDTLIDGRFLEPGENAVLLGSWLAEDIGAEVGYYLTLVTRGQGGFFEAIDVEIAGIVNCPNPYVNRVVVMMPLDVVDDYLFLEGAVTEIDIKLPDTYSREQVTEAVENISQLPGLEDFSMMTWMELAADYLAGMEMERGGTGVILILIFIIAAVGISNTMLMSIFERTRELGMMRSMGMPDRSILITFMFEAAGIGLIGSLIGVALSIPLVYHLIHVGLDYGYFFREMDMMYRIQAIFRGAWNVHTMLYGVVVGTILSTLIAYFPTRRALKMDIPSCLRHQ